ncbi:hypothetical protein BGZ97_011173 [Linnemannia gamsii]|uniref:Uncharacterized protein n=1 Tax=Linnemannia gamsii TaxID=64522 RepID=A0A9P6R6S3_9FUNG|nr:hypothetical protein BGZ97_011173 [Linnemannia gamsii]
MLSLLYLVDQANGPDNSPEWTDRIRGGIRFLAEKCKEDLVDIFEEDTQVSPSPEMDSEGGLSGYPRDDVDQEDDRERDGEYWEGESEEDDEEDNDGDDGDGDEEAESGLMMLREDDFRDPWRVAGKSMTTASSRSSISSVDGINFGSLDLNRRSSEQQRQDDPSGSTEAGASEGGGGGGGGGVLILGADVLCQVNHPFIPGGILWLCEAHNEMLCKGMAAEKLRQFIKSKKGNCIPMEKSAEIQFREREDARVFYRMLDEYKCVIKLKIGLDFDVLEGGVTEEDMWELCWAIHCSTVRDLTVDCGGGGGGASFRPLLGMMCRMGFVALTVENFDGSFLSPDELLFTHSTSRRSSRSNSASHHTNVDADVDIAVDVETSPSPSSVASQQQPFSLIDFRASPTIMSLPDNIQLKKLTFRHWTRVPDRRAIINLIRVLPNLTELETMTDSVEMLCQAIQDELQVQAHTETSRATYHPLSHLNLLEVGQYGSEAEFTLSKPSGSEGNIRILETHWKTNQSPRGLGMLQSPIGLETLEFTQCVRLWEMAPELQRIVGYNYSTLRKVEIVCATERMADVWVILRREFMQPMTIGSPEASSSSTSNGSFITNSSSPTDTGSHHSRRVSGGSDNSFSHHQQRQRHQQLKHRGPVHLLIHDRAGHILESPNVEQYDQTILDLGQYDETFRPQLELQCQIAKGLMFSLRELVVCLTSRTFEDVEFMKAIWNLMDQLQGLQSLTIQMHDDGSTLSSTKRIQGGRQDKSQGQDMMPRRLLEAFRRVARIEVGSYWNERFERWMQELLVQERI